MTEQTLYTRSALGSRDGSGVVHNQSAVSESQANSEQKPAVDALEHGRYQQSIGQITLAECESIALVSIAFQAVQADAIATALRNSCELEWPPVGLSTTGVQSIRLMALQADQYWLSWPDENPAAEQTVRGWLGDAKACLTNQSDGWACLEMTGASCQQVMERLCAVDLHDSQCPVNTCVRTVVEHTGTLLIRVDEQQFRFISPRSSVRSLLHAIESVAVHIKNEQVMQIQGSD